jgi:hypothetical protein
MPALKAARELDWRISRTVGESWCLALDSSVSMTPFFALSLWQKKQNQTCLAGKSLIVLDVLMCFVFFQL